MLIHPFNPPSIVEMQVIIEKFADKSANNSKVRKMTNVIIPFFINISLKMRYKKKG